ncbi:lasso peptide biosynthesis B2 protein [Solirubrobacter soli]|uniref:lasso peptide biosynthesis B2 protein n=1 Tax=Solirubrobacter soli TaxID=363832 RepID=UPI00040B12D5|nr:lasso peptide biosynthesis B2 protein [Solirubrobacter soli]
MRRPPDVHDARAGLWAWRALRSVRAQLRAGAMRDVQVPAPPEVRGTAARAVRLVLARQEPSCLERALVLQRWLLATGEARDVVVGTRGSAQGTFEAHAWLEGETLPAGGRYVELTRLAP